MLLLSSIQLFVIIFSINSLNSEPIFLRCDSWDKGSSEYIIDADSYGAYCTITGLSVAETQNVILATGSWDKFRYSINFVKFYDSSLLYIPQTIFDGFSELQNLDVSNSEIVEISRNTFSDAAALTWLNASYNHISRIAGAVFLGASKLRKLDLSNNRIERLNEYSFNGLRNLVNLDLSSNQIVDIERKIFSDNVIIESVNLRDNRIDAVSPEVFNNLNTLASVNLAENDLTQLDPNIFKKAHSLNFVSLSGNHLKGLHLNLGESVKYVYADDNELTQFYLNCSGSQFKKQNSVSCASVQTLQLSNNNLTNLVNITSLLNLYELSLSYNKIGKVNISTFTKQENLEVLRLRNCNLSGLTFGTFRSQTNLKYLDISENSLQHLNLDIFLPYMYRHLEEFYLGGNNLSEVAGRHTFAAFSSLKKLGLDKNNFNCSYLLHLISFSTSAAPVEFVSDVDVPTRENIHGIECTHQQEPNKFSNFSTNTAETFTSETYDSSVERLRIHERQLEQHLLLMRIFVILIAVLGLSAIIFKVAQFVTRQRGSWINTISYQSTSSIRSEAGVP